MVLNIYFNAIRISIFFIIKLMIISKTPYRISFFGGGTDYPSWYNKNGGQVVSTTINKYIYITLRDLPQFFDHNFRIVYTKTERVNKINEIQHPVVREVLKKFKISKGLEIHYDGDLPARSGLGSSSAFTVGLINTVSKLLNQTFSKKKIASDAIFIEQKKINEVVGSQDQVATSFGGFNKIIFKKNNFSVKKIKISKSKLDQLENNLLLVFTGKTRIAPKVAKSYISNISSIDKKLEDIYESVNTFEKIIKNGSIDDIGLLLDHTWRIKRTLSKNVSNELLDNVYSVAIRSGAIGGKILGAGAGGFFLFYAKKENHKKILNNLKKYTNVPFKFDNDGTKIIYS